MNKTEIFIQTYYRDDPYHSFPFNSKQKDRMRKALDQLINSEQNRIIRIIEGHLLIKTIRVALIKAIRGK